MSTTMKKHDARFLSLAVTHPATPSSGDPVIFGQLPGVALTDESDGGNATGFTTVDTAGVHELSVKGENNAGNTAITAGDIIYYDSAATPVLNVDATNGVRYGYALAAVSSGATTTIEVKVGY